MIISAKRVRARKDHRCDGEDCGYMGCCGMIKVGEHYTRLYGMSDYPDPPYVLKLSDRCVNFSHDIQKALARSGTPMFAATDHAPLDSAHG